MSENCTHDCSTCKSNCKDRDKKSLLAELNPLSKVDHVIAVVSGKGGKSEAKRS